MWAALAQTHSVHRQRASRSRSPFDHGAPGVRIRIPLPFPGRSPAVQPREGVPDPGQAVRIGGSGLSVPTCRPAVLKGTVPLCLLKGMIRVLMEIGRFVIRHVGVLNSVWKAVRLSHDGEVLSPRSRSSPESQEGRTASALSRNDIFDGDEPERHFSRASSIRVAREHGRHR